MKKLGNVLTAFLHIAGVLFLAAMCAARHMTIEGFSVFHPVYDVLLIVAAVFILAIHYFFFEKIFAHTVRTWILACSECLIAIGFIFLISVPNNILCVTLYDGMVVLMVQLFIVSARVISIVNNYRSYDVA